MNSNLYHNKALIYKFTSPTGKSYIGQSVNFKERYKKYKYNYNSVGKYFSKAIEKYGGIDNFNFEILCEFFIEEDIQIVKNKLDTLEKFYIKLFETNLHGYNLTEGGKGSYKRVVSSGTRLKLSLANKGKNIKSPLKIKCDSCCNFFQLERGQFNRRIKNKRGLFCSKNCSNNANKIDYTRCLDKI